MNKSSLYPVYIKTELLNEIINSHELLKDLHHRLVEDYNCDNAFNQYEEDRLITYKFLLLIDMIKHGSDLEGKYEE